MGIIRLKNMTFYGYHGVYDFEKEKGTDFEIDLELFTPLLKSSKSDNIEDTINYDDIYYDCLPDLVMSETNRDPYYD